MKSLLPVLILSLASLVNASPTTQKLWTTDLPAFLNENPGKHWIVGHSTQPALSAAEAETLARRDAAEALAPQLATLIHDHIPADFLRRRLESSLATDDWIVDRQVQSTERPYGTIWSGAVLVDASSARMQKIAHEFDVASKFHRARNAIAVAGVSALLVITAIFYTIANWLTRGYFRGRLILTCLVMLGMGAAFISQLL
jgi:hypothetical protein